MAITRPKSLSETVLKHLRDMIVGGEFQLGQPLSERQLAEDLAVSKTPVREALAQLKNEGLVSIAPQKGARVFTLSAREVIQICEFRLAVESAAVELAFERQRQALYRDIRGIVSRMGETQRAGDIRSYLALDTEFHQAFFTYCGNDYLRDSYDRYVGKIAALRTHLAAKPLHTKLSFEEHKSFLAILAGGTVEEAKELLKKHIGRTRETYADSVEDIAAADKLSQAG